MNLSVVIVNWKAKEYLPGCFDSLMDNLAGVDSEVFFVDNGSEDGGTEWVRTRHPAVCVIENRINLGFSRANNLAIREARGEHVLLLNPDTLLRPGAVKNMMALSDESSSVGIVGPRIEYPDGTLFPRCKRAIPEVGDALFYLFRAEGLRGIFSRNGGYTLDHLDPREVHEVGAVSGSCMLIKRSVFSDIGFLDEEFFLYGEDLDFCLRAKRAGWRVIYCPTAVCIHYHGESSRKRRLRSTLDFYRAMRTFYRKHYAPFRHPLVNGVVEVGIEFKLLLSLFTMPLRPGRRAG